MAPIVSSRDGVLLPGSLDRPSAPAAAAAEAGVYAAAMGLQCQLVDGWNSTTAAAGAQLMLYGSQPTRRMGTSAATAADQQLLPPNDRLPLYFFSSLVISGTTVNKSATRP
jgi:hypothetical protein